MKKKQTHTQIGLHFNIHKSNSEDYFTQVSEMSLDPRICGMDYVQRKRI